MCKTMPNSGTSVPPLANAAAASCRSRSRRARTPRGARSRRDDRRGAQRRRMRRATAWSRRIRTRKAGRDYRPIRRCWLAGSSETCRCLPRSRRLSAAPDSRAGLPWFEGALLQPVAGRAGCCWRFATRPSAAAVLPGPLSTLRGSQRPCRESGSLHARAYLGKRRIAGGRRVVAEGRESTRTMAAFDASGSEHSRRRSIARRCREPVAEPPATARVRPALRPPLDIEPDRTSIMPDPPRAALDGRRVHFVTVSSQRPLGPRR